MLRYRRNIDCLTTEQLHDLREALAAMYGLPAGHAHGFATLAGLHGDPPPAYCRHGAPGFLTWHRAYMVAFEQALQCVKPGVTLSYWDWSSGPSTGVPVACRTPTYVNRAGSTVANPLYSGPRPGGGQTARRTSIDTTSFDDLATSAQTALAATSFSSFQSQLNGVHGAVHVRVGGDMSSVPTAGYDPIFYLHHANVDRLWAQWQQTNSGSLPSAEASLELQPFNRPFSTDWQLGSEMTSTDVLGYRYRPFCVVLPPIRLWEVITIRWPHEELRRVRSARLAVHADSLPERSTEVRVFVDQPRATGRTKTIGNRSFAGAIGLLGLRGERDEDCPGHHHDRDDGGHAHGSAAHHGHVAAGEVLEHELDITHALKGRDDEELTLKLVAVDANGDDVPAEEVNLTGLELLAE